ncbi:MerR family transcriptional regulator [Nocardia veterana]|uniref:MerR family transcriptional regulator n=2 Tax=Nocardia veterana TaxID=132249 RepID=A0A7X6RH45_9NOCA|nr:MerR family transcriptional regulator [Nocardia veterana]
MSWSIAEVAKMSGVTARTLRHYDDIGLLAPAYVGSNGYRYYGEEQLLRLQQILVLRELGLSLTEIAAAVDSEPDTLAALKRQYVRLLDERDRLGRMADTVARTIAELERNTEMTVQINRPENLFAGFDHTQYDDEARQRWPEEFEQSRQATAQMTPQDIERMQRELTATMIRMAEFMAAGTPVDDAAVQAEIHEQYQGICRFWTPTAEAYRCLGQMYVDDERFKANYDKIAAGLAEYQRDAMAVYADQRLAD